MTDPAAIIALASAGTAGFGLVAAASLKGWEGWLELKRLQASAPRVARGGRSARPELAELRARVRRLEAIANGAEG